MESQESDAVSEGKDAKKVKAAIVAETVEDRVEKMFGDEARKRIGGSFDLYPEFVTGSDIRSGRVELGEFEVIFGTWGFPVLEASEVRKFKCLRHVFFGAGSIKKFGLPFLKAGIGISTSKATNSKVVADFCLGQILMAAKRYFQNVANYRSFDTGRKLKDKLYSYNGYRESRIALIGCGSVSRHLIERLKGRRLKVFVVDPYLTAEQSRDLGVEKVSLEAAFSTCDVVSNHLPNLPELEGLIEKRHFESMIEGATFMNTGRGAQVRESDLVEVFEKRSDLIALLDVTEPEPPLEGSRLYTLPNALLSSHIAGCVGQEVHLLIDEAIESSEKWLRGEPLGNEVTLEQFNLIA